MATGGNFNTNTLSDETFDIICAMCKNQGKNTEAVKFCMDCQDYYCLTCVKVHNQVPVLISHKVIDVDQVSFRCSSTVHMTPTENCNKHRHKHIDMFCQDHDEVGCSTCMAVDHRLCENVFYIPEFVKNSSCSVEASNLQLELVELAKILTQKNETLKQDKQLFLKRQSELLERMKLIREDINNRLDVLEKSTIDMIDDEIKEFVDEIDIAIKRVQESKANVVAAKDKLLSAKKDIFQNIDYVKLGEKVSRNAVQYTDKRKFKTEVGNIEFTPEKELLSLLEKVNFLGTLTKMKIVNSFGNEVTINSLFKVKNKETYCVRTLSDAINSDINSLCVLGDGTIILADYNNLKVKRLNSKDFTVRDYFKLRGNPWKLCSVCEQQLAVSIPPKRQVFLITVGSGIALTKTIGTDFDCFGLAYGNNNLYITDESSSVYIYTLSGKKLRQIGIGLFSDIRGLAISKDSSKIYVADFDKGLVVLNNDGNEVGKFSSQLLQGAFDCHVTEKGSVLVCGCNSKNVLQFSPTGRLLGEILKLSGEGKGPRASYCIQQMSKMVIGLFKDNIEVYALETSASI